jgi:hypothetical protein
MMIETLLVIDVPSSAAVTMTVLRTMEKRDYIFSPAFLDNPKEHGIG